MHTVFISRGSYRRGKELAECLADKMGCPCLSREELIESATRHGIPVGKLEEAVVKRRPLNDALSRLAERYRAFVTATLSERALAGDLVYHGRAGHLALAGVSHVFRVRALTDVDDRCEAVTARLRLSREKAQAYVEGVDEDIRRWIRTLYNLDINDPSLHNLTVNCSKLSVGNIAAALVGMVQLPDFRSTPASERRLRNLQLAATCRLALADDPRTQDLAAQVRADDGQVAVTFQPRQAALAEAIPTVLADVPGLVELRRTVATSTILWVQERFQVESDTTRNLLELADRWGAAIDVIRLLPEGHSADDAPEILVEPTISSDAHHGGILDDTSDPAPLDDDGGVRETLHHLIQCGRAGTLCVVGGGQRSLIGSICSVANVSLVVIDNVFLDKGAAIRTRLARDLESRLAERLRVPVIGAEELKSHYLFGATQWVQLVVTTGLTALLYILAFTHQDVVLSLLRTDTPTHKLVAVVAVVVTAPAVAFLWGTATQHLLRLVRFE